MKNNFIFYIFKLQEHDQRDQSTTWCQYDKASMLET